MATYYNPQIVTNGLVLCLDAANTKSYPGTGSTWTDLSGNGNTGTLTNGPTFSSANGGAIVFDGVNEYSLVNNNASILSNTAYTKVAWFNTNNLSAPNNIISGGQAGGQGQHAFWLGSSNRLQSGHNGVWNTVITTTTLSANTWYCGAVTFSTTSGWNLYLNGALENTNVSTTTFTGDGRVYIASFEAASNVFSGRISNAVVYNRALAAAEIRLSFNALRGRYGI